MHPTARAMVLASALLGPAVAHADPPRASLTLTVDTNTGSLREVLRELLDRLGVRADFNDASSVDVSAVLSQSPRADLVARVWVDLPARDRARLFVVNAAGDRVFVRTVPLARGLDEVARETLAHVVADAVDALAHGATIGVHRDTLREPPVVSSAVSVITDPPAAGSSTATARAWRVHLTARAEAQLRGASIAAGGGLGVGVSWPLSRWRLGVRFGAQYRASPSIDAQPFTLRTSEVALRASGFARVAISARGSLELSLGAGVDRVELASFAASDPRWQPLLLPSFTTPVGRAELSLRVRLAGSVGLTTGAAIEADLAATRYVAGRDDGVVVVLAPWPLRPSIALGVDVEF